MTTDLMVPSKEYTIERQAGLFGSRIFGRLSSCFATKEALRVNRNADKPEGLAEV